jgi:hypothetical protein
MSKISVLVGEVVNGEPTLFNRLNQEIKNEKFYYIEVQFLDAKIKVVFSEYIKQEKYYGKIAVTGYLASLLNEEGKPDFFFYANLIESVDLDTPITNEISFTYKVTKTSRFKANSRGVDILPLVVADYTAQKTTSVLYLCARGQVARRLKDKPHGYYITGNGYLKQYRNIYEVIVLDLPEDGISEVSK